ncbi:MAG: flagellar biosynthesis protein [Dyella sp.]
MSPPPLPPAQRKVVLKLSSHAESPPPPASLDANELENLLDRARALGLPLHHDAQIAALLVSLRLRPEVPPLLYAAAAAVLTSIYAAASER